ncbi:hypothetical protein Q1695_015955 [Nippostrongylus brasiliensis]|nr:hypothetical protein Q1695_015955 [Nippostrongylus brasiliensis]
MLQVDALRMSESISKNDLAAFFGTKSSTSGQNGTKKVLSEQNNKDLREYYSKTNQSLVMKVYRLEVELANTRKLNEELRSENAMLMSRLHSDDADVSTTRKIEAMVEERIRRRMDRLRYIGRRSIDSLQKATSTLKDVFGELGVELGADGDCLIDEGSKSSRNSLVVSGEPCLPSVSESPPMAVNLDRTLQSVQECEKRIAAETPTGCQARRGGPRRSELFGRSGKQTEDTGLSWPAAGTNGDIAGVGSNKSIIDGATGDKGHDGKLPEPAGPSSYPDENVEVMATPLVVKKRLIKDTPAVPWAETDTVRRKRTATLKIKTMAEPKLNSKLRRPGRYDEPHPFVTVLP